MNPERADDEPDGDFGPPHEAVRKGTPSGSWPAPPSEPTANERALQERVAELERTVARLTNGARDLDERRRTAQQLRALSHYARSLLEASLDPLLTISPDGQITDANHATEELTGLSREVLLGTDFANYCSEPERARAGYRRALGEGFMRDYPLSIRHASGRMTHVLYNAVVYRNESGEVQGVFAAARDITEQMRVHEALRASEANLRKAQAIAHVGSWHFDRDPNLTTWSDEVLSIFQIPPGKRFAYDDFVASLHPEDVQLVWNAWGACLRGEPMKVEHRVLIDGQLKWLRGTAEVRFDEHGALLEGDGTIQDITERKCAEEAFRHSEERFTNVFEHAPIGMALIAIDGRWLRVNRALVDLLGYSAEDLSARTMHQITHPDDREAEYLAIRTLLEDAGSSFRRETRYLHKDGRDVYALSAFCLVRSTTREPLYFIAQVEDITLRKQAELELRRHREHLEAEVAARTAALQHQTEELRRSQAAREGALEELRQANLKLRELDRLKSMFIASMSHELRTPLNSVIGFTGVILQGLAGPINDEQKRQLGMVKNSASHLLELINDVIDINKIEAGLVDLTVTRFDLSALARAVADSFATAVQSKRLALSVDAPEPVRLESDERRTRQMVMNLVSNAVKYSDRGRIDVVVRARPEGVMLSVHDTGIGIGPEDLGRLFHAFQQIHTPGRPKEGSGLGLYLSRRLAEHLGGSLTVESELGRGSTFRLHLPYTVTRPSGA